MPASLRIGMTKGLQRLEEAKVKNVSLTNLDVIVQVAAKEGYIQEEDIARILAFRNSRRTKSWIGEKQMRSLIDILELSVEEIDELIARRQMLSLQTRINMREACSRKKLATLFFEPSTRTSAQL